MDDYPMYGLLVGFSLWGTLWRFIFPLGFWNTFSCRVETRTGMGISPYTAEQEAKVAAILKERREKEAKKKALLEAQATKLKKIEEEMAREKERLKKEEEAKLKEVEEEEEEEEVEEEPLERGRRGNRGESSGPNEDLMEKKISEWVAGLTLGEDEEALMYVPRDEQKAAVREWEVEGVPLKRQVLEDEKRMEWKFRLTRERKRRMEAATEAAKELEEIRKQRDQMAVQVDLLGKVEILAKNVERLAGGTAFIWERLLRKETIWKWDKDCTSAMKKLKQALIEYPVLKVVDPSLPFVVTTDASQYGIGVVLQQDDGHGYRPVEFMSARMPSEKIATSTYKRELYALRQALDHWKHYLLGRHFKVYSDHETLRWLKTQAKTTSKLTRWAAKIDQYDFELKPVKGKYNVVADALSRTADYFGAIVHYLDIGRDLRERVKEAYAKDPIYSDLLKRVKEAPETEPNYRTTDGLLFEKTDVVDRLCIPNSEEIRSLILGECHDTEGHFGWQKTLANLLHAYTWPGMKNDYKEYVRSCKVCQRNKTTTRAPLGLLRPLPIPDQPRDSVSIDFMDAGVKSRHGKSQVMVIVNRFSKYAVFIPLPSKARTELVIRKFFDHWVGEHGVPLSIVSDRDTRFTSQNWQELMRVYGSKLLMSSGRHPETNSQTEQTNKVLQQVLRMYIRPNQVDWDEMLPKVASAYNNSVHLSTCRSPNELHKSFRPRRPFGGLNRDQIHRLPPGTREFAIQHEKELATVVENLRKAQHRMIEQANKHRRPSQFQVGDLVWVKAKEFAPEENISQKLLPAYRGPWPVLEVKGGEDGPSYTIEIPVHLHTTQFSMRQSCCHAQ
ncbi:hypothetical protein CBR_g44326 [Chara braunii]|uniref:Integrase catalytic domain-containing protein n=1 Tax=Chara braunii TaxID=69332 RepID=A0A388K313_CHABU|nr:hypothetical protein CBR_g44326 [Chara braunii]|eukprot:GBG64440.1 hypothetical protein CBR_g44326 [Chara braunii]